LKEKEKEILNKLEEIQFVLDVYELENKLNSLFDNLAGIFENKEELRSIKEQITELLEKVKDLESFARTFIVPKYVKKKSKEQTATYYRYRAYRG